MLRSYYKGMNRNESTKKRALLEASRQIFLKQLKNCSFLLFMSFFRQKTCQKMQFPMLQLLFHMIYGRNNLLYI